MYNTRKFLLSAGRCLLLALSVVATGMLSLPSPCLAAASGLHVVATTFPIYLFTRAVAQGRPGVRVDLLIPAQAGCPHDYALTTGDMKKLSTASVIVANGLGMEDFMDKALHTLNRHIPFIDSSVGIQPLAVQEDGHSHDHVHGEGHHHEHGEKCNHSHGTVNPHAFSSPRQAARIVRHIARSLGELDPQGAEEYARAADAYALRLEAIGHRLVTLGVGAANKKVVLLHDATAYLFRDAGLHVMAVIQENEHVQPSAARMLELTHRLRQDKPVAIVSEPQYSDKAVRSLSAETGVPVLQLDPVASGPTDADPGYYEQVMLKNCEALEKYFGK